MRFFIVMLTFSVALFAEVVKVVDCKTVLKTDPVPTDKYISYNYHDIKNNPDEYVCIYMLSSCDDQDNYGWAAINKHRKSFYVWNKDHNTSLTLIRNDEILDDSSIGGFFTTIDKYGIHNGTKLTREAWFHLMDYSIKSYLSTADMCDEVQAQSEEVQETPTKEVQEPNKDIISENCWGDPSGVGDVFCD